MLTFWEHGYANTSITQLENATGISRISIYNRFGDKEGLFLAALKHYQVGGISDPNYTVTKNGLTRLKRMLKILSTDNGQNPSTYFGCMLVNSVVDIQELSPKARAEVQSARLQIEHNFAALLRASKDQLQKPYQFKTKAAFLANGVWGILTTNRLFGNGKNSALAANQLIQVINSWQSTT